MPAMIEKTISANDMSDQMIPQQWDDPPYFLANTLASELLTLRRIRSSHCSAQGSLVIRIRKGRVGVGGDREYRLTMSQTLYSADITPINKTKKRNGSACLMNQHAISSPTLSRTVMMVSQSLRAHHNVSRKQTPRTILATLLATISNPQKISRAPINEDPRYPAGNVIALMPPRILVTPPCLGSREMDSTFPPVQHDVAAWLNSWKAITSILKGQSDHRT